MTESRNASLCAALLSGGKYFSDALIQARLQKLGSRLVIKWCETANTRTDYLRPQLHGAQYLMLIT